MRALGCNQFGSQYTSARKEPDACVIPVGMSSPSLIIDTDQTESRAELYEHRNVWLIGGSTITQVTVVGYPLHYDNYLALA